MQSVIASINGGVYLCPQLLVPEAHELRGSFIEAIPEKMNFLDATYCAYIPNDTGCFIIALHFPYSRGRSNEFG